MNSSSCGTPARGGSISVVALLLPFSKLLLLPTLGGAFFLAPIHAISSASKAPSAATAEVSLVSPGTRQQRPRARSVIAAAESADTGSSAPEKETKLETEDRSDASARLMTAHDKGTDDPALPLASGEGGVIVGAEVNAAKEASLPDAERSDGLAIKGSRKDKEGSVPVAASLWNVPNVLTMARVVAIPVFATFFYAANPRRNVWCAGIFAGAALTDWLDGYIARRQGIESPFGAFLDPVADKLMVSTALILLSDCLGAWMTICTAIILCRELAISALREWMAQLGLRDTVKVGNAGKWKTATQMVAVSLLLLLQPGAKTTLIDPAIFMPLAKGLLYVSTLLTITSGSGYLQAAWPTLSGRSLRED